MMPLELEGEMKVLTRAMTASVTGIAKGQEELTRATPPATNRPKAETPFMEAAPVA
jgi:hypothetical protein